MSGADVTENEMTLEADPSRTFAQAVNVRLAGDILAGRLAPGSRLKLHDLCASYGAGMSPLREALASLAGRGLVVQEGQRGFRVASASLEDLADVVDTRSRIESMALRLSIERGDADWEGVVISSFHVLSRHERTPALLIDERWEALHHAFHASLIAACGSPRLRGYCRSLHEQFDRYRRIAVSARGAHATLERLDAALVEATLARDAETAVGLLKRHVAESGGAVAEMLTGHEFAAA